MSSWLVRPYSVFLSFLYPCLYVRLSCFCCRWTTDPLCCALLCFAYKHTYVCSAPRIPHLFVLLSHEWSAQLLAYSIHDKNHLACSRDHKPSGCGTYLKEHHSKRSLTITAIVIHLTRQIQFQRVKQSWKTQFALWKTRVVFLFCLFVSRQLPKNNKQ